MIDRLSLRPFLPLTQDRSSKETNHDDLNTSFAVVTEPFGLNGKSAGENSIFEQRITDEIVPPATICLQRE